MNDSLGQEELELRRMCEEYEGLPYNAQRLSSVQQALALAERLKAHELRIRIRYDLAWACAMCDDPAKALPVCAEYFALRDQFPDLRRPSYEGPSAAMIAAYVAITLPQIPLERCRALLEQFHQQVRRCGLGERLWQMHACHFSLVTGDAPAAEAHLAAFRATPRDDISDCPACEAGNAAECLLWLGRREEAEAVVRPVLEGNLTCEQQPQGILSMLINDDLDHGNLAGAAAYSRRLERISCRSRADLGHMGALLRCRAYTEPESGLALLERGIGWSLGMWDRQMLFNFYLGAWVLCTELSNETISLRLSKRFPLYRDEGLYSPKTLARWFYEQAESIAARFDARNGSDRFGRTLERAGNAITPRL